MDLFAIQSRIITHITIWLCRRRNISGYFSVVDVDSGLELIDSLRPLRLKNIRSASHIVNDYKVISSLQRDPSGRNRGKPRLT